ncbi:hypothetical protein J437_LFUL003256 [Ladona fulva]|uniref:Uncharacterized protein n=1 Tax=Ladona fulva TaxID=123851 RepID=A0A8K0JU01_LADFU|nr:hypothetical protein J437_LFUL003256 [Ladona fulva]
MCAHMLEAGSAENGKESCPWLVGSPDKSWTCWNVQDHRMSGFLENTKCFKQSEYGAGDTVAGKLFLWNLSPRDTTKRGEDRPFTNRQLSNY